MSVITLPPEFRPSSVAMRLAVSQRVSASPFCGSEEAVDLLNDRWMMSCELPARKMANGAWMEAFIGALRGQSNTVPLYHFARPAPLGTIRGNLTLSSAAAQGASSIVVSGAYASTELIENGTFDTGTIGWAASSGASITTSGGKLVVTQGVAGVYGQANTGVNLIVGQSYTFRYTVVSGTAPLAIVQIDGRDYGSHAPGNYSRDFIAFNSIGLITLAHPQSDAAGSTIIVDNVSVTPTGTFKQGDLLGVGSLLLMVAADCTAVAGVVTVPITNRLRVAQPINAAVTWDKPTFNARLLDTSGVQYRSAVTEPVSFDFGEAI